MSDAASFGSPLLNERLISLSQAARMVPSSRQGRPVSPSCVWRWHRFGVKTTDGRIVRLEALRLVNRLVTTEEALRRFIAAQQRDSAESSHGAAESQSGIRTRSPD